MKYNFFTRNIFHITETLLKWQDIDLLLYSSMNTKSCDLNQFVSPMTFNLQNFAGNPIKYKLKLDVG